MKKDLETSNHFMGSAKVGPKGQIVIPKEVRDMFGIKSGDTLIILADSEKGIAMERYDTFAKIADAIFSGKAKELYPDHSEEDSKQFAKGIKEILTTGEDTTNE